MHIGIFILSIFNITNSLIHNIFRPQKSYIIHKNSGEHDHLLHSASSSPTPSPPMIYENTWSEGEVEWDFSKNDTNSSETNYILEYYQQSIP
jgi:hypothetical protein